MKAIDFVLSSAEAMNAIRDLAKSEGVTINGEVFAPKNRPSVQQITARLENASEEEVVAMLEACGLEVEDAPERVGADEVVIDMSLEETVTTSAKDGNEVTSVVGEYIDKSGSGFNFRLKSGKIVTFTGDKMFQLWSLGGLKEGAKMPFKPESLRPSKYDGYWNGIPNFSADANMQTLLDANAENRHKIRAKIAEIRALKLPKAIQDAKIASLTDAVIEPIKLTKPTFS